MARTLITSLVLALLGCTAPRAPATPPSAVTTAPPGEAARARLVVLLVIDQWPAWAFAEKQPALPGGFARLLREGTWHTGEYPTPATLTGPGHVMLGTGEPPARSGILANEWWDRETAQVVQSTDDGDRRSARRLRVPGLGDAVAAADTGAKAVAISLKDRAAILPLGHAGTAIWYDAKRLAWTSTRDLAWLAAHNRARPIAPRLDEVWTPLDPARLAALSGVGDDQPGEVGEQGFGPTFPHAISRTADPPRAVFAAPLGNDLVFETAEAAIDAEQLGRDDAPDLLVLSLSAHDYVGHGWGHESWEAWDMTLRLDRRLDAFLAQLDAKVGAGGWAMVVTSDHGGTPLPERTGGGRFTYEGLADVANRAASGELGPGRWVEFAKFPTIYLSAEARARPPAERARVLDAIAAAVRAQPGIERVEATADFVGGCERRLGEARAICLMLDPERSGELLYLPARGWVMEEEGERLAAGHGSMHAYDRRVPILLVPAGGTARASAPAPASLIPMTEIAPLLATWLGVPPPSSLARGARGR